MQGWAHPGVGIVIDSRGTVYYTDLVNVWKIDAKGKKTIALPNVHTHELYIDAADNLYGEHLRYEGEATNRWHHRIWKLSPDGKITDVLPLREGFRSNYSFVRDREDNMYWTEKIKERYVIRRRNMQGAVATITPDVKFTDPSWMACSADRTIYIVDRGIIRKVDADGHVTNIIIKEGGGKHSLMGIYTGKDRTVYIANYQDQIVQKVDRSGGISTVVQIPSPWSPTGVGLSPAGDIWILEYSTSKAVRVRRKSSDGTITVF
jgi:streptogramin lyase